MATFRDNPYGSFNFRVTVDRFGAANAMRAGFQEISGMGVEMTIAEYRNGNELENHVRKIPGVYKVSDVTLKRGVIGTLAERQRTDAAGREAALAAERDALRLDLDNIHRSRWWRLATR